MRKHWSVFEGLLRSKMKGMLLTVLLETVLSIGGYWLLFGFQTAKLFEEDSNLPGTELFFGVWAYFGLTLCVLSCVELSQKKSNRSNLYRRLLISERMEFFWDTVCNMLMFLFLWAVEIGILYVITSILTDNDAYNRSWSYTVLSIYLGRFRYAILPMQNALLWIRCKW